jgi:hypothetical protein
MAVPELLYIEANALKPARPQGAPALHEADMCTSSLQPIEQTTPLVLPPERWSDKGIRLSTDFRL